MEFSGFVFPLSTIVRAPNPINCRWQYSSQEGHEDCRIAHFNSAPWSSCDTCINWNECKLATYIQTTFEQGYLWVQASGCSQEPTRWETWFWRWACHASELYQILGVRLPLEQVSFIFIMKFLTISLVPRPHPAFRCLQYRKAQRAWYPFSREHDIIIKWSKIQSKVSCIIQPTTRKS